MPRNSPATAGPLRVAAVGLGWVTLHRHLRAMRRVADIRVVGLADHRSDKRPHLYSRAQLEAAETHDPYWNAAQREMVHTGFMHTYMRMYWGKKILEWSKSAEQAYKTTLAFKVDLHINLQLLAAQNAASRPPPLRSR